MKQKLPRLIILCLFSFFVLTLLIFGYFGFIPGLSFLMGSTRPKNLRVHITEFDQKNAMHKMGIKVQEVSPSKDTPIQSHTGLHKVKTSLSQEEVTAISNMRKRSDFPLSQIQVKFIGKNKFEMSCVLSLIKTRQYFENLSVDKTQLDKILSLYKIPQSKIPIYIKASGGIKANEVNITINQLQIGRYMLPKKFIEKINEPLNFLLTQSLQKDLEAKVTYITVKKNIIEVDGYWPTLEKVEKK